MALANPPPTQSRNNKERPRVDTTFSWHIGWRLSLLALPMLLPLCDPAAEARGMTDPAMIDRAVADFTGVAIGAPGGARAATDTRLQLAPCAGSLAVSWHTAARNAVQVECPGPVSWRIFVAITPASGAAAAQAAPAVKRGDALTIMVRGRGFSVQQQGEAMEAGAVGDWIEVRTNRKGEPLRARIERPGLAVIPAA
jgi:flagella basal body P-ring formation protein FlgA